MNPRKLSGLPRSAGMTDRVTGAVVILGVGNLLLGDEGVGVHAAWRLCSMSLHPDIRIVEGGTEGFGLLDVISGAERLIIIDCVKGGGNGGEIYRFSIDDAMCCPDRFKTSVHQIGILEVVHMAEFIAHKPVTTIIGVEPVSIEMSMELSETVSKILPRVIALALEEAECYLAMKC